MAAIDQADRCAAPWPRLTAAGDHLLMIRATYSSLASS